MHHNGEYIYSIYIQQYNLFDCCYPIAAFLYIIYSIYAVLSSTDWFCSLPIIAFYLLDFEFALILLPLLNLVTSNLIMRCDWTVLWLPLGCSSTDLQRGRSKTGFNPDMRQLSASTRGIAAKALCTHNSGSDIQMYHRGTLCFFPPCYDCISIVCSWQSVWVDLRPELHLLNLLVFHQSTCGTISFPLAEMFLPNLQPLV